MILLFFATFACRVEGSAPSTFPPPSVVPVGGSGTCHGGADHDLDGWIAIADGGHDCDDADALVGDCSGADTGDSEGDCVATGVEVCNGRDDDCDGVVDDRYALVLDVPAKVVAAGAILAGKAAGVVIGEASDSAGVDGKVAIYDASGTLVVEILGVDQSPSFGSQVATGRDLTGDGVDDLVVAAPYASTDDGPNSGRILVFAGPISSSTTIDDAVGWFEGGELDGQPGGQLALLPDLTGDGRAELVFGYYRHAVGISGAPAKNTRLAGVFLNLEMNTGGGAWHFASLPDRTGDGRPELLLGMDTFDTGAGYIGEIDSTDPSVVATTYTSDDWRGLGSKLTVVDGVIWTLSGGSAVRVDTWSELPYSATNLADGGDLDGDGHADLLVETAQGIVAPNVAETLVPGHLQSDRSTKAPSDVTGDGVPDPRLLLDDGAAILDGATAFSDPCDADGDGTSAAYGDCDDEDPLKNPNAHEVCDGVDSDCDGTVDAPAEAEIVLPRYVNTYGITLAGNDAAEASGLVLGVDGVAAGFGAWAGTEVSGLQGLAWGGDLRGLGTVNLLGHAAAADVVLGAGTEGAAADVALARFYDGTGLTRTGTLGTTGDFDGDGTIEVFVAAVDPSGHSSVALFGGPVSGDKNLDDATWLVNLPDGWSGLTFAAVRGPIGNDLDGDGRDDLLIASAPSYYGQGRVSVYAGLAPGVYEADGNALVDWYGEPGEALGSALAVGGDTDGDGLGDALVASAWGVRTVHGGACPILGAVAEGPNQWLGLVDLDGDGIAEPISGASGWLWRSGERWREATNLWGAGGLGLVFADADGTWVTRPGCSE